MCPLYIVDKATGDRHEVNKLVYHPENEPVPHVWCDTWYGHHVIGKDCEWYRKSPSKEGNNISKPTFWDVAEAFKWAAEYNDERGESLSLYEGQWTIIEGDGDEAETEDLTPGNVAELYCLQKGFEKEGNKDREIDGLNLLKFISEIGWGSVGGGEFINHNNGRIIKEQTLLKEFNEWDNQQKEGMK